MPSWFHACWLQVQAASDINAAVNRAPDSLDLTLELAPGTFTLSKALTLNLYSENGVSSITIKGMDPCICRGDRRAVLGFVLRPADFLGH